VFEKAICRFEGRAMTQVSHRLRRPRLASLVLALACLIALGLTSQASAAVVGFFSPTGGTHEDRTGAAATPLPDGRVLLVGGNTGAGPHDDRDLSSAEVFNPATHTFSWAGIGSMSVPRRWAVAAPLPDGRALVAGGVYDDGDPYGPGQLHFLSSAEVFDPSTNTFSSAGIGSMSVPREGAVAAPLPDGRVLVAGGFYNDGTTYHFLSSAEVFDPATNTFSSAGIGSMSVPRTYGVAAPLPDGRVLVGGGASDLFENPLSSAEVFNPATNSFSSAGVGSMTVPRNGGAAAPLGDGRVLVVGGSGDGKSAEAFDPATNSFSSAGIGSMTAGPPRGGPVAAPLPDGRALVAGGYGQSFAEIFSLATNDFTFTVQGKQLIVSVQAPGEVSVADAASRRRAFTSRKKWRKPLLKGSSTSGSPPTITVPLVLTNKAKSRLKKNGKVTVKARITFTGPGGLANTQTTKLHFKGRKK
jgi:hypothetical protein